MENKSSMGVTKKIKNVQVLHASCILLATDQS